MSMEGTSRARKHHFEESEKKSKKSLKRKVRLDAVNENAEDINEVHDFKLNITGLDEAQAVPPLRKSKKKEKVLEDVKQQVADSREKTQDNEQERSLKRRKRAKFNLESSNMLSDQEKREPDDTDKDPNLNGMKEDKEVKKKPSDTTWVQKASWKSLVGETGRVSFSLGGMVGDDPSMLPGGNIVSMSMGPAQPSMDVQSSNDVNAWIEGTSAAPLFGCPSQASGHLSFLHVKNTSKLIKESETQSDSETLNHQSVRTPDVQEVGLKRNPQKFHSTKDEKMGSLNFKQADQSDHQNGAEKICRFMRSDNYEQEWLDAKRAVKDIFKRSRKDALRSMKMFHKKHNQ